MSDRLSKLDENLGLLAQHGLLEPELAEKVAKMVGFRNLLVHEYEEIDPKRLRSALEQLDDFRAFAESMSKLDS
jgi:uncharacterized protein YutE (UPF0331/DUF86 family)